MTPYATQVGVLYMDAGVTAVAWGDTAKPPPTPNATAAGLERLVQGLLWQDPHSMCSAYHEDIVFMRMVNEDERQFMQPPVVPFIDTALLLAWHTDSTVNFFRDASDRMGATFESVTNRTANLEVPVVRPGASSYVLNSLCNDGREIAAVSSLTVPHRLPCTPAEPGRRRRRNATAGGVSWVGSPDPLEEDGLTAGGPLVYRMLPYDAYRGGGETARPDAGAGVFFYRAHVSPDARGGIEETLRKEHRWRIHPEVPSGGELSWCKASGKYCCMVV
jgi:hypothetical protein